jgi:hypothetical protein
MNMQALDRFRLSRRIVHAKALADTADAFENAHCNAK